MAGRGAKRAPIRIALLRSVVIGPHRLGGEAVRRLAEAVGATDIRSVIATGNLIFRSPKATRTLERDLEVACAAAFGRATEMIVKTPAEWRQLMAANPFTEEAEQAPARLLAWAMREPLPDIGLGQLRLRCTGDERVERTPQGDFYCWFGEGSIAGSKLAGGFGLRSLGAVGTNRNWNTMHRITAVLDAMEREKPNAGRAWSSPQLHNLACQPKLQGKRHGEISDCDDRG